MRNRVRKATVTPGEAHVSRPLTNLSVAYIQSAAMFGASTIFPTIPVAKQSDLYYEFSKEDFLRDEAKPRAPATESAGGGFSLTTKSYAATVEAFHKDIDDQLRTNADSELTLDEAATRFVTQKMLIRRERRFITSYFGTGIWGTDLTPSTLWSAASGSRPDTDVETGKLAIAGSTGFWPNTLVLGPQVFSALRTNSAVRDQFKYTSAESISAAMLARFFDIERVIVLGGAYTSSIEGASSPTTQFIAGKHALLCYVNPAPSLLEPSAGYTFSWNQYTGSINGVAISRYRAPLLRADRIEGEHAYDMKVVASSLGYFFNSCVS